LIWNFNYSQLV